MDKIEGKQEQVLLYAIMAGIGLVLLVLAMSYTAAADAAFYAWLGLAAFVVIALVAATKKT